MTQDKVSRDELIRENTKLKILLSTKRVDIFTGNAIKVIPWFFIFAGFCYGVYETATRIIPNIAGKKTILDVNISIIFSITLTGLSIIYAYFERRLRKIDVKNLAEQLKECRKKLDLKIRTSGLSPDGDTNKEDEP